MPICLNCGKNIPSGKKYCDECATAPEKRTADYLQMAESQGAKKGGYRGRIWVWISGVVILAVLTGLAYGMMSMFPAEEIREKQAERCRGRMERVENAALEYTDAEGELPPEGRVSKGHVLVIEGFLAEPLKCPTTEHYYVIKHEDGGVKVVCDSGIEGHELK